MGSREEILANFQACTGIEDVEVAICQLEAADWSLMVAVNKAIGQEESASATTAVGNDDAPERRTDVPMDQDVPPPVSFPRMTVPTSTHFGPYLGRGGAGVSLADDFLGPSGSTQRTRMLEFNIQFGDKLIHLMVPDQEDVRTLKTLIQGETGIPPCKQELTGFNTINAIFPLTDRRRLSELNLPRENLLFLLTQPDYQGSTEESATVPMSDKDQRFQLDITIELTNRVFSLKYPGSTTILSVKMDVSDLSDIPVSKQIWTGWPENASDPVSLAECGIPLRHKLSLVAASPAQTPSAGFLNMPRLDTNDNSDTRPSTTKEDSESDFEEIQADVTIDDQDDDDLFGAAPIRSSPEPLIPDDYGDEEMAGIKFGESFSSRYGNPHPNFFPGSLDFAIRESCLLPAKDRKMLAIYFHHDSSVFANVFCQQTLCSESVTNYLNENFVCFGWDITLGSNRVRAVNMITRHFGSVAAMTIKNIDIERLPLLVLVYRLRGSTEFFQIIHGTDSIDELMTKLLTAHETYQSQIIYEIREDEERVARDAVKREQDLAYEMSLKADREKEAQKQRDEAARLVQEIREQEEKKLAEEKRVEEEREKERLRAEIRRKLPPEPSLSESAKISRLRFRIPAKQPESEDDASSDRQWLERRFLASDKLGLVFDFLAAEGFSVKEYKVLSSWPRRDITTLNPDRNLEEVKLVPQETLTLEEK